MKCHCGVLTFLAVGLFLAFPLAAHAALTGYWPLHAGAGPTAVNLAPGGVDGVIFNDATGGLGPGGQAWILGDPVRGTVLSFNGDNGAGAYVDAGDIPPMDLTTDYTWSFWAKQDNGGSGGNVVMLGNRYNRAGGDDTPRQFIKFTPTQFEYHVTAGENVDYADIPDGRWIHHAVVKSGDTLTYYRDGAQAGQQTITLVHNLPHPLYFGGDAAGERWQGYLDEVATFDSALAANQIAHLAGGGSVTSLPAAVVSARTTHLSDDFSAAAVDTTKWNALASDFEAGAGTYTADTTTNPGELTIAGVNDISSYWGGLVLESVDTFDSGKAAGITVDRVSLAGSGTAYRSSLWIKQTDGTYLHYAQNVGENGWQYNPNNTGGGSNIGALDSLDGDTGLHQMSLAYIPLGGSDARVEMYLDGVLADAYTFSGDWENATDFYVRLSGMARQAATATEPADTVSAVFDNFAAQSVAVSASQATQNTSIGFTVSNSDLLEGLIPTVIGNIGAEEGQTTADPAALTNGLFGDPGLPGGANADQVVAIHNSTTLTYQLDTAAGPAGYDITGIDTYSGWRDAGRDAQEYTVLVSLVDDPDVFVPLDFVSYNPTDGLSPSDTAVFLTEASGGVLASGVSQVRFAFGTTENGFVGYREFDVFGGPTAAAVIPEPSTLVLAALGLLGLVLAGWQRKR